MRAELKKMLDSTGIDSFAIKRPENHKLPCIVYTIKDYAGEFADCIEEGSTYDIYLNLYIKENIFETIDKIKKIMNSNGFAKVVIHEPIQFDGLDYYQVAFNYTKYKTNEI